MQLVPAKAQATDEPKMGDGQGIGSGTIAGRRGAAGGTKGDIQAKARGTEWEPGGRAGRVDEGA